MNCACTGKGLDVALCDFHARVYAGKNNRLMIAARALGEKVNGIAVAKPLVQPELDALREALVENGAGLQDTAGPQYAKKAHFLLRRAYDALTWIGGEIPFPVHTSKARSREPYIRDRWKKEAAPLLEELRKVFKPST